MAAVTDRATAGHGDGWETGDGMVVVRRRLCGWRIFKIMKNDNKQIWHLINYFSAPQWSWKFQLMLLEVFLLGAPSRISWNFQFFDGAAI